MTFKLHIPGRLISEAPAVANPANPLIGCLPDAVNDAAPASTISGIAGLAAGDDREADHEAKVERSAIISADGVPHWDADRLAGLPAWTDGEIVNFEKRLARITWLGYPGAAGLAEKLLHRDRDGDDRRLCVECAHAGAGWRCARREAFLLDQLQRCPMFKERPL